MSAILSYISAHWLEWLFALLLAILAGAWKKVSDRLKLEHDKNEAVAEGVQALLRESIVSNYNHYLEKGYCPIYAKESLKKVYHAYHNLKGNDVATSLYKKVLDMPEEAEKKEAKHETSKQNL